MAHKPSGQKKTFDRLRPLLNKNNVETLKSMDKDTLTADQRDGLRALCRHFRLEVDDGPGSSKAAAKRRAEDDNEVEYKDTVGDGAAGSQKKRRLESVGFPSTRAMAATPSEPVACQPPSQVGVGSSRVAFGAPSSRATAKIAGQVDAAAPRAAALGQAPSTMSDPSMMSDSRIMLRTTKPAPEVLRPASTANNPFRSIMASNHLGLSPAVAYHLAHHHNSTQGHRAASFFATIQDLGAYTAQTPAAALQLCVENADVVDRDSSLNVYRWIFYRILFHDVQRAVFPEMTRHVGRRMAERLRDVFGGAEADWRRFDVGWKGMNRRSIQGGKLSVLGEKLGGVGMLLYLEPALGNPEDFTTRRLFLESGFLPPLYEHVRNVGGMEQARQDGALGFGEVLRRYLFVPFQRALAKRAQGVEVQGSARVRS